MISIKNVSGLQKIWGGYIFAEGQERTVEPDFKHLLCEDSNFFQDVLSNNALVYVDYVLQTNVIQACDYIFSENRRDEEGNTISRLRQVPSDFGNRAKSILFTTGVSGSLSQEFWPLEYANECVLSFFKESNGALVSCTDTESTYSKLVWVHPFKTMQKRAIITIPSKSSSIRGWVGVDGYENTPQGKLYMGFNFCNKNEWELGLMEPKMLEAPFCLLLRHANQENVIVELMFEYFTNFQS